jgi:hypothetical protein
VKQFCRFWIWSERECKTPAEYGLQLNSIPPHPYPLPYHTLSVYNVHLVWERVGGGQREGRGATVHMYSSYLLRPWGQQFTSWVENTNQWVYVYLQSIKSVKHNAAKSVNRSKGSVSLYSSSFFQWWYLLFRFKSEKERRALVGTHWSVTHPLWDKSSTVKDEEFQKNHMGMPRHCVSLHKICQ